MVIIVSAFALLSFIFLVLTLRADRMPEKIKPTKPHHPPVSIIIPCHKSAAKLERTLKSITSDSYMQKEIIVVNDGGDRDVEFICKKFGIKTIKNAKRIGKGLSLNKGASAAKNNYFLFLDADTTLEKNTLKTLFDSWAYYHDKGDKIGMIAPASTSRDKKNIFSRFSDFEHLMQQNIIKIQMNFKSILSIRGCCLLVSKESFSKATGFSATPLEDGDFAAKIIKAGYNIKYEPRALVYTGEPESMQDLLRCKRRYGKGAYYCLLNHKTPYLNSLQSFICFYTSAIIILAFFGSYILYNFVNPSPILLFIGAISVNGIHSFLYTFLAVLATSAISSAIGNAFSRHKTTEPNFAGQLSSMLIFISLLPVAAYAYIRGIVSGISDKRQGKPELILRDW